MNNNNIKLLFSPYLFIFFLLAKNEIKLKGIQKGYPNPLHITHHVLRPPKKTTQPGRT